MKVCVYGAASSYIEDKYINAGFELGKALANAGHELVFGGGGHGLMGSVARGTHAAGGTVTGILPDLFKNRIIEDLYTKCDSMIYTPDLASRKSTMEDMSDAFIVAPGGIGTYDEFFSTLVLKQLEVHHKPIVLYNVDGFFDKLLDLLRDSMARKFLRDNCLTLFKAFSENKLNEMMKYLASPVSSAPVTGGYKYG